MQKNEQLKHNIANSNKSNNSVNCYPIHITLATRYAI